jgi:hypothetical protein
MKAQTKSSALALSDEPFIANYAENAEKPTLGLTQNQ